MSLFAHADFYAINICVSKNVNRKTDEKDNNMRKIRKVIADSTISYYDRDGVLQRTGDIPNR